MNGGSFTVNYDLNYMSMSGGEPDRNPPATFKDIIQKVLRIYAKPRRILGPRVGYQGSSEVDAGYYYCPYVPLGK